MEIYVIILIPIFLVIFLCGIPCCLAFMSREKQVGSSDVGGGEATRDNGAAENGDIGKKEGERSVNSVEVGARDKATTRDIGDVVDGNIVIITTDGGHSCCCGAGGGDGGGGCGGGGCGGCGGCGG